MMHTEWTDRISAYLDHELEPAERAALESHLEGCAPCRQVLEELRQIVAAAPSYTGAPPGEAVWRGVAAGINARRMIPFPERGSRRYSLGQMVAAAAVVALLAGGGTWLALGGPSSELPAPDGLATTAGTPAPASVMTAASLDDPDYQAAVEELEAVLAEGRERLDTATVRVIEENLRVIDAAIAEARAAIAADPSNAYLGGRVKLHMQRKMVLLRQAVRATGAAS